MRQNHPPIIHVSLFSDGQSPNMMGHFWTPWLKRHSRIACGKTYFLESLDFLKISMTIKNIICYRLWHANYIDKQWNADAIKWRVVQWFENVYRKGRRGGDFLLPRTWRFSLNSTRQIFAIICIEFSFCSYRSKMKIVLLYTYFIYPSSGCY